MKIERCIQDWIKVSILAILDPQILSKNNEQKWVSIGYFLNTNSFGHKSLDVWKLEKNEIEITSGF